MLELGEHVGLARGIESSIEELSNQAAHAADHAADHEPLIMLHGMAQPVAEPLQLDELSRSAGDELSDVIVMADGQSRPPISGAKPLAHA